MSSCTCAWRLAVLLATLTACGSQGDGAGSGGSGGDGGGGGSGAGGIGAACEDLATGASRTFGAMEVLFEAQDEPQNVYVDAERVYWSLSGGAIASGAKAAGAAAQLLASSDAGTSHLAGDCTHLYGGHWRLPKQGGTPSVIAAVGSDHATDGEFLYQVQFGSGSDNTLLRVPVAGGEAEQLAGGTDIRSLAIDETHVFYNDGMFVHRVPKAGGTPEPIGEHVDPLAGGGLVDLEVGSQHVYALGPGDRVVRWPKSGGPEEDVFAVPITDVPLGIRVWGDDVYYWGVQRIEIIPGGSGPAEMLLQDIDYVYDIAVDSTGVYFAIHNDDMIARLPRL